MSSWLWGSGHLCRDPSLKEPRVGFVTGLQWGAWPSTQPPTQSCLLQVYPEPAPSNVLGVGSMADLCPHLLG